ncbi:MAG: hypothetical protein M2R45_02127 [Verrucomicrobia subdivision 3 bacterium]|nr:hypothetical protein [Limisphaerales bacterium]MCS1413816.1 hypothetical protein [Limisphaerales bacterium]
MDSAAHPADEVPPETPDQAEGPGVPFPLRFLFATNPKVMIWCVCRGRFSQFFRRRVLFEGKDGLPYNHCTWAAASADGSVWFGMEKE